LCALASAATIEMVTIGNPGNAPDLRYVNFPIGAVGSVPYVFRIAKYEGTAGQYTEFLNAVAKNGGLYHANMADTSEGVFGANIQRSGSPGNYVYSVAPDWADRPVNWVDPTSAARFANWLHNGQPTGPQGPGTTEDGAYVFNTFGFPVRVTGAKFWIPTIDEWHKAAYHDKSAGIAANYFDYPAGSNSQMGSDITETTNPGNNGNFRLPSGAYAIGAPYYRTLVGEFELSQSPYGTFDQGGNISEWMDPSGTTGVNVHRGGWFHVTSSQQPHANNLNVAAGLDLHSFQIGFRVASLVPEPSAMLSTALGSILIICWHRGDRRRDGFRRVHF
jgi:formylglycine-generating enzyme required for sulfatase activity